MELNYTSLGSGRPLLVLHGLLGSSINWLGMGKRLAESCAVYLIDLRNHGLSPHSDDMSYPHMAADIRMFIRRLELKNPVLMGHSMGGKVAMECALAYPDCTDALVVLDIAPRRYPPIHGNVFTALLSLDLSRIESRRDADALLQKEIPDKLLRLFLLKNLKREEDGSYKWQVNIRALSKHYDKIWAGLEPGRIFDKDTLFVSGGNSNLIEEKDKGQIAALFPRAEIETIQGAGHWLHTDKPEELLDLLHRFLAKVR
jgi:pimeloyl-ACP methyl ester carboxylesterase